MSWWEKVMQVAASGTRASTPRHLWETVGFLRTVDGRIPTYEVEHLADLIDRPTCSMVDIGDYQPKHRFKRMACSECGAMHWEQPQKTLPRMRYCPWCGREVVEDHRDQVE